jgi:hypothetical protein
MLHSITDGLAVLCELFSCMNDFRHLSLRQPDSFTAVAFEQCSVSHGLNFCLGARLEKLAPLPECTKIDKKLMLGVVAIWTDFDCWLSHAKPVSCRHLAVNNKFTDSPDSVHKLH